MSQLEMSAPAGGTVSAPNLGKNLFWDDVRIGLNVLMYGVMVLVVGAVASPFVPTWVAVIVVFAGAVGTVLGLKICASIPAESGVNLPAQGAFFLAALCFVLVIFNWFTSWTVTAAVAAALVLGAGAHVTFAVVLKGCVSYLRQEGLLPMTLLYVLVAAAYSIFLAVVFLTELSSRFALIAAVQLATLVVAAFLCHLLCAAAAAVQQAQQGLAAATAPAPAGSAAVGMAQHAPTALAADMPHSPPGEFQFSKSDVDSFGTQDATAAKAIVALMTGVFSIGVILYTIIALMARF